MLEILTELPYSFIFHEPALCNNKFNTKRKNLKRILELGIDVNLILNPPSLIKFKQDVIPVLKKNVMQIGVKEVWSTHWKNYLKVFPDTRIIIIGRDPRDLYISICYWRNRLQPKRLSPRRAKLLKAQINIQKEMFNTGSAIKVRYEDLCNNQEETILKIKEFVNSPIPDTGKIGAFLSTLSKRKREYEQHGNEITTSSIGRWKTESNKNIVRWANKYFDSIPEYCDFWGYEKK
jgi:hypothetical protein